MKLKRQTAKKLASLSAIGSGILVAGASEAQAGVIVFDITPNENIGFSPGAASSFATTRASFGGIGFNLLRQGGGSTYSGAQGVGGTGLNGLQFAVNTFTIYGFPGGFKFAMFDAGQTLGAASLSTGFGALMAGRFWGYTSGACTCSGGGGSGSTSFPFQSTLGNLPFSHKYALFRFILNSEFHYGWVDLSLDNPNVFGPGVGPTLTVHRWAISDVANALVGAGDLQELPSQVPEPSSLALSGLGALALGAAGVRRWKAARQAARKQAA